MTLIFLYEFFYLIISDFLFVSFFDFLSIFLSVFRLLLQSFIIKTFSNYQLNWHFYTAIQLFVVLAEAKHMCGRAKR